MEASGSGVIEGDGYAVAHIDDLGDHYGFRTIRRRLGVTAFGVNAVALPAGYATGRHWHDEQEELYFVHQGVIEMEFGDGSTHRLEAGGIARVDASTVRRLRNVGDGDAIYLCAGGKGGYVGRDGRAPEGETRTDAAGGSGAAAGRTVAEDGGAAGGGGLAAGSGGAAGGGRLAAGSGGAAGGGLAAGGGADAPPASG